ncbi:hypothetical protein LUZ60_002448 [Juncus effusus]|nr:hypothetical protein LUZ60_002448 [Juncus effusus]
MDSASGSGSAASVETRPAILLIGSPNVGKRTLLSRLLRTEITDTNDLSAGALCQGWSIQTKYYTADVSVWVSHLTEDFSLSSFPYTENLTALVMVFDMNQESSLYALQKWVARTNIEKFEILLCIGNKADLVPGHQAHATYKYRVQTRNESESDPLQEYSDFGRSEEEGSSLLWEKFEDDFRNNAALDWCTENNVEYVEACASNADFDKCLSVDGDMQGVERVFGAISAHMWPGMILKSGNNKIHTPILPNKEESSDEESEYEIEYETLSHGSDYAWKEEQEQELEEVTEFSDFIAASRQTESSSKEESPRNIHENINENGNDNSNENGNNENEDENDGFEGEYGWEEMERVMSEIGNVRDNLRLMPDFQRRDMAAKLATRMAALFGGISDDEETI